VVNRLVSADNVTGALPALVLGNLDGRYADTGSDLPAGITGENTYVPRQQVYNNATSMRKARAAQARALSGGAPMNIMLKGDSIGQGAVNPPFNVNSWFARVQAMIENRFGKFGSGMNFVMDIPGQDSRYTQTGTWATLAGKGIVSGRAITTTTAGSTLTFTDDFDRITVYYLQTADGGTDSSYTLNTGAPVTFSSNGTEAVQSFTVTATRASANKLVLTAPSSGRMTILAVDVRIGANGGFRFQKAAYTGQKMQNFTANAAPGDPLSLSESIAIPDLTIIALETNDYANGPAVLSSYVASMRILIESGLTTGSVVLVATPTPRLRAGIDGIPGNSNDIPLDQSPTLAEYTQALYSLADEYDLVVVDMQARWGDWDTANAAGLMLDNYHPNDRGNWDYALAVYEAVFGPGQSNEAGLAGVPHKWTAAQTFGLTFPITVGQVGADGLPTGPAVLSTSNGDMIIGNGAASRYTQIVSDVLVSNGKKFSIQTPASFPFSFDGAIKPRSYTTATLPSASLMGAGAQVYNTTTGQPVWSNGTAWRYADGTVVS
jgi:hypothetical protein